MTYTPMTHVVRHTYTPENGRRGLQFTWYEGARRIAVHRPDRDGGWDGAAFTDFYTLVTRETFTAVCDDWALYGRLSNLELGEMYRAAQEQNTPQLAAVRAQIISRGFILAASDTQVGALVRDADGLEGVVTECNPSGSVGVDWGHERVRGCPGSRGTLFLVSALETGMLMRR